MTSFGRRAGWWAVVGLLALLPQAGAAKTFTYKVKHEHTVGGCQGELIIGEKEVRYESNYRPDSRIWTYPQIKKVERKSQRKLTIYTYEDQVLQFGRDKPFNFIFLDGDVTDELFNFVVTRLRRNPGPEPPATPPGGRYELAVKHKHLFGGCQGVLKITDQFIEYVTTDKSDQRLWKYLDIKRIEQGSAYELEIYTYEDQLLQFGRDKVFRFELKEPLEPEVYEFMVKRMHP